MNSFRLLALALLLPVVALAQNPPPAKTFTRTITLVRHGHYDADPNAGPDGPSLSTLGIAQAKLVAARLRGQPAGFTTLVASTMTRARETAFFVNQALPEMKLRTDPLLRECTPRSWNAAILKEEKPEDMAAAEAQLNAAFAKYFVPAKERDESDLLVCHGNVIRYLVTKALGVDPQAWFGLSVAHCSLTVIQVKPDGSCKVLSVGDAGHIPPNLTSGLTAVPAPKLVLP